MKYEDPIIDETTHGNANVSSEAPAKTFLKLLAGLAVLLALGYALLSVFIFQLVRFVDFETEKNWFEPLSNSVLESFVDANPSPEVQAKTAALQNIADKLVAAELRAHPDSPLKDMTITVHYSGGDDINAFAMPAGHIVVMQGLIDAMPNENVLAMVIGHEIGHVVNRDSLTQLGRSALTNAVLMALFGADTGVLLNNSLSLLETGYSRGDENRADQVGLQLLHGAYDNAYGAPQLFDAFAQVNPSKSRWVEISSTHPLPVNRRKAMQAAITEYGFDVNYQKITPLPPALETSAAPTD